MSDRMHTELTAPMAEQILARMGEIGQPPEQGIQFINVGNEILLDILDKEYLDKLLTNARGSAFKLVQGYYGGGKTHFLYCVRDVAWNKGFLTSLVSLSPKECPYEDPYLVYKAVAANLSSPPETLGCEAVRSVSDVLREFAEKNLLDKSEEEFTTWYRKTALRIPVENHNYRRAAAEYIKAIYHDNFAAESILEAWLSGDQLAKSDFKELGIFEVIERSNAFQCLCSMVQVMVGYGYKGIVLLFDEVDRNLSISRKRVQSLGDNLRQVIDLCGQAKLPGVLFLYAVPPEFMRNIVPEYPALFQRLNAPLSMSRQSPQSSLIDLESLELNPGQLLESIGSKILKVCQTAWGWQYSEPIQISNLQTMADYTAKYMLDIGHRRLFIKNWISFLYSQHSEGESLLTEDGVAALMPGAADSFSDFDDETDDFSDI